MVRFAAGVAGLVVCLGAGPANADEPVAPAPETTHSDAIETDTTVTTDGAATTDDATPPPPAPVDQTSDEDSPDKVEGTPDAEAAEESQDEAPFRWSLDIALGGGSVVGFTDPLTTGHSFWGGVWFNWDRFAIGIVGFGVYPGSRVQTRFGGVLLDVRWYFLGGTGKLRPFAALALGYAGGDSLNGRTNVQDPVRWAENGSPFLLAPAAGLRWGGDDGLFVSADARLINASHLTLNLGAGFSF